MKKEESLIAKVLKEDATFFYLKTWQWVVLASFLFIMVFLGTFYAWYLTEPVSNSKGEKPVLIEIKKGMSAQEISKLLYQKGLIKSIWFFDFVAKNEGLQNKLKAGVYAFTPDMTLNQIIAILNKGETAYVQFTIPEGFTIKQIAEVIEKKGLGNSERFQALAQNYAPFDYMKTNEEGVISKAEGFLFPDTYSIIRGTSEEEILKKMVEEFDGLFTETMRSQAKKMGLSIREVVTMASLVEREAQLPEERAIIASVFLNRLRLKMPLQSCATIQYILGEPKPELSIADTQIPSPYNTYLHAGLPVGPIANPGLACIKAVLEPAKTNYLYFVVNGKGGHHFSTTYEEHLKAMRN